MDSGSSCRRRRRRRASSIWPSGPRRYGFSHVWTFDSHILWQEPYVIYSQILAETRNIIVGPMVTNPATRDWTVTASVFATLNEMYGNRTVCGIGRGDSAVRVTNGKPTTIATLRESIARHPRARQRAQRRLQGLDDHASRGRRRAGSRCGSPATGRKALALAGEVGDGFILQLADPHIAAWTIDAVREAAERAGRDPDAVTICVAAPAYVGDDLAHHARPVPLVRRDGRQPRRRHRRPLRRRRPTCPQALTDYIKGRAGLRLQRARPGRQHAHRLRARRDRRPLLHPRPGRRARRAGSTSCASLGVDQFAIYLQHDGKDATLQAYGEHVIPGARRARRRRSVSAVTQPRRVHARRSVLFVVALVLVAGGVGAVQGGRPGDGRRGPRLAASCRGPTTRRCRTCGTWSSGCSTTESRDVGPRRSGASCSPARGTRSGSPLARLRCIGAAVGVAPGRA